MERISGCAPEHICALFRRGGEGTVEMVNSRGIYLQLGGRRVLLCHSHYGTVPNGAALDVWDHLHPLLSPGQPVRVEGNVLCLPTGTWQLQLRSVPNDTHIRIPDAGALQTGLGILLENVKPTGLSALAYPLLAGQSVSMNRFCQMALPHAVALLQALHEDDTAVIPMSVDGLLGLGPGLTPSGDDLLSGLLYGLRHSPVRDLPACIALRDAVLEKAGTQTNGVSAAYLCAVAEDAPFDRMAEAWADPAAGAVELVQIGSNSGTEMLLGLMCAATVCTAKK